MLKEANVPVCLVFLVFFVAIKAETVIPKNAITLAPGDILLVKTEIV